jgi:hypothetical protein
MNNNKQNESTFPLFSLLPEIIRLLPNYFLEEPEQNKSVFKFSHDWRNFMNTSKKQLGQRKKESQIIVLREPLVDSFYTSFQTRKQVYGYIEDPRKQLELEFNANYYHMRMAMGLMPFGIVKPINLKLIGKVKRLCVHETVMLPAPVEGVNQLEFTKCRVWNQYLPCYSEASTFHLLGDGGYFPAKEIFDLSLFHGLEDGAFDVRRCKNYHRLGKLKSLSIYGCESIVDVSCFQKIPKLRLQSCPNLRNVSCLGGVHDLALCNNEQITDVSALGNVHSLNLRGCTNVVDVSALSKVEKLTLSGCSRVTDVSGLQAVVDLDISGCLEISNITMLHNLKSLEMRGCEKINDLTGLVNLRNLTMDGKVKLHSNSLQVISQLSQLSTAENPIIMKDGFEQVIWSPEHFEFLQNIPKLSILRCSSLTEFPSFTSLQSYPSRVVTL